MSAHFTIEKVTLKTYQPPAIKITNESLLNKSLHNIHSSDLQSPHFENISSGKKIYECRINDEKRQKMSVNHLWQLKHATNDNLSIMTIILERKEYKNFEEAIKSVDLEQLLPGVKTVEEAIELYHSFPGYKEKAEKYGVVIFKVIVD